jgi:hypothetical protein
MASTDYEMMLDVYENVGQDADVFADSDVAHVVIHQNEVIGAHLVPGLIVEPRQLPDGVELQIAVEQGARIDRQVHMCFGVMPEEGLQRIVLDVDIRDDSHIDVLAHCVFPNAVDVTHKMDAEIRVGHGATYRYFERHVHGADGGVLVVPKAQVHLGEGATFETEFELVQGRVGQMDIEYETWGAAESTMQMVARVAGRGDDRINVREVAHLEGRDATGVLLSRIAVRDRAVADIYSEITATAAGARGHVDCKEIVQGDGIAKATPIVSVEHPRAHITHEAALGSVDSKELETLMARGMEEEAATDLIIQALLSRKVPEAPL